MTKKLSYAFGYNMQEYWESFDLKLAYNATSNTDRLSIPANTIVQEVLATIIKPPSLLDTATNPTATCILGDSSDTDGFIKEFSIVGQPVGTLFGNDTDEIGDYLLVSQYGGKLISVPWADDDDNRSKPPWERLGKYYSTEGVIIATATLSIIPSVEGNIRFWIKLLKLSLED